MESVHGWAAGRGRAIEPYGTDLAPRLVELARARLPQWSGRIEHANAIDYRPADGRRFTFVHVLPDAVPAHRRLDLIRHLRTLVEPGGRLLISHYGQAASTAWLDV
jgi:SAM-dependent methyltransferase